MSWVFWCLVNGQLPFVGWVEGNFNNFWIFLSDRLNRTHHQLTAFEKGWFGSISSCVALENWTIFTGKEYSAITEGSNATKVSPGFIILNHNDESLSMSQRSFYLVVDVGTRLIFSCISFMNFIIEPHVSDCHSVLEYKMSHYDDVTMTSSLPE